MSAATLIVSLGERVIAACFAPPSSSSASGCAIFVLTREGGDADSLTLQIGSLIAGESGIVAASTLTAPWLSTLALPSGAHSLSMSVRLSEDDSSSPLALWVHTRSRADGSHSIRGAADDSIKEETLLHAQVGDALSTTTVAMSPRGPVAMSSGVLYATGASSSSSASESKDDAPAPPRMIMAKRLLSIPLERGPNGLGLQLDDTNTIVAMAPGGAAETQGNLREGDTVLSCDGVALQGVSGVTLLLQDVMDRSKASYLFEVSRLEPVVEQEAEAEDESHDTCLRSSRRRGGRCIGEAPSRKRCALITPQQQRVEASGVSLPRTRDSPSRTLCVSILSSARSFSLI